MACETLVMPGGRRAIVCGVPRGKRCACGRPATLACDWKVPRKKSGTCDAPICEPCSINVAPDKDLCTKHAEAFAQWKAARATELPLIGGGR